MKLSEIIKSCKLQVVYGEALEEKEVTGGYASDLLSDVMANSRKGDIWITLQTHPNIVAVATLKEIAAIVIINKRKPEAETVKKAEKEKLSILTSDMPAFEIAGQLYTMGLHGKIP